MVKMPKYSFQGIRAKLCALLVECRSSWRLWIHVEEVQQFIFCAGGALGNKESDKLIMILIQGPLSLPIKVNQ